MCLPTLRIILQAELSRFQYQVSEIKTPWYAPAPCHFAGIYGHYQDLELLSQTWQLYSQRDDTTGSGVWQAMMAALLAQLAA